MSSTSFHPFSGSDNSFPSGHATQAFAVASVISAHSDQVWVSVTAYTIAGLVGFSRIYHNAHWTSDVTAGALIGTFVGRGVVALNKRLRAGDKTVRVAFARSSATTSRERASSSLSEAGRSGLGAGTILASTPLRDTAHRGSSSKGDTVMNEQGPAAEEKLEAPDEKNPRDRRGSRRTRRPRE